MTDTNPLHTLLATKRDNALFMAHMIAGYPSIETSRAIAQALVEGGADIIEMQIPFSDPMADGPTIAAACEEALRDGATVRNSLELLSEICAFGKPVAVMSYTNPVFRFGIDRFVETIKQAGASALIVPDCPFDTEEGIALLHACAAYNIFLIPVVSPGVPQERLETLAKDSHGFVYCTSRQGITGATGTFAQGLDEYVALLKKVFDLPIAVGFGVKSKEDVASLSGSVDIVIAGSVFVSEVRKMGNDTAPQAIKTLVQTLVQ